MHCDHHVGGTAADGGVDHVGIDAGERLRIVAAIAENLALLLVAQVGQVHFIKLQVSAALRRENAARWETGSSFWARFSCDIAGIESGRAWGATRNRPFP